jgi:non-heme chloroperoxidase
MMAAFPAAYACIKAFSETDFTEDLKKMAIPTLFLHGDDDQIVPIADSAMLAVKLVKNGTLKVYKGAPHGMCTTLKEPGQRGSARVHQSAGDQASRDVGNLGRSSK